MTDYKPKDARLNIRIEASELEKRKKEAARAGLTLSAYCAALLEQPTTLVMTIAERRKELEIVRGELIVSKGELAAVSRLLERVRRKLASASGLLDEQIH